MLRFDEILLKSTIPEQRKFYVDLLNSYPDSNVNNEQDSA